MKRAPRSAGVRPRSASMGQHHTLRSIVIILAITMAITNSPASSFTINRQENILKSLSDLDIGESTQLEVRYDLKTTNASGKNETIADPTVIAINDHETVYKKNENNEKVTATPPIINEIPDIQTQISEDIKYKNTPDISKLNLTDTGNYSYTTSVLSTSQTTTREPEKSEDVSTKSTSSTSVAVDSQIITLKEYTNEAIQKKTSEHEINQSETKTTEIPNSTESITAASHNIIEEVNSTEKQNSTNASSNFKDSDSKTNNGTTESDSFMTRKDSRSMFESDSRNQNESSAAERKPGQKNVAVDILVTSIDRPLNASTTTTYKSDMDVTSISFEEPKTEVTTEYSNTGTTDINTPTMPTWKKYTTIDRKRTSTEDTTTLPDKDMVRAETAQTRISLEKVFSETPIPSLEKLKNDLINAQESTTRKMETTNVIDTNVTNVSSRAPNFETSTQMTAAVIETETKSEIVSIRAGYKDNRETTTPKPEVVTTSDLPPKVRANNTEMFSSIYETEPSEVEVSNHKNITVFESQSQLAEDAIKEELLKEETLHDIEENAKRHHEEPAGFSGVNSLNHDKKIDEPVITSEITTEDMLSVKPIGYKAKKNTVLYAVSPNYKPLKKIDVQPPKQFIRDPDDNSWRNESISSLGIVFKPKNASKSFTQVLKNKTETELGNMTDKDNNGDVPDLRVRLEKITEVRKSKKKKFGDTAYSDYEESGENANLSKEDTTSSMSPLPRKFSIPEFDLTVNAVSREKLDFFKNDLTTPIRTKKPKKFYNLPEYYDATDEYDADYVNLHKIDLKKFTQPIKSKDISSTQAPELLGTPPMREYQPERKATIQYFPPTQKVTQKVKLNDYDTGFNRKLNLYTFKEPSKTVLPASYGTVSPIPTEKYEPQNKLTLKPAYTPSLANQPQVSELPSGFVPNDGNFNRASYVIKHYRDFINEAAKGGEDSREYLYTESPIRGVTINEMAKISTPRDGNQGEEDFDYDVKFRKDIINRFVDNFNQNSERFKVDFPVLYNSSVVHSQTPDNGQVASSSAFLKRLYDVGDQRPSNFLANKRPCSPHCDMTVELSPAYELHYYVPDQEEKEEIEPQTNSVPFRYRL